MAYEIFLRGCDIFVEAWFNDVVTRILESYGYDTLTDKSGNIVGIDCDERDMNEHEEMYMALASFMRPGSYLEFFGELGDIWRWVFFDGDCHKIKPVELWIVPSAAPTIGQEVLDELDQYLLAA